MNADTLRVMSSVPATEPNPYFRLFYGALRPQRVELVGTFSPTRRWLREHRDEFDVLHFHWPEWIIRSEPDWLRSIQSRSGGWRIGQLLRPTAPWARLYEYRAFLGEAREYGKVIAWTCHNVEPHDGATWPVRAAYRALARSADLVICHDQAASAQCRAFYAPPGRVVVMEHGNYDGVYAPSRSKEDVLREAGLQPGPPLLLCVGHIRAYKGTDLVCQAVAQLGNRVSLLIAGATPVVSYARHIKELVRGLPNAAFVDRHLTEQEFADFVGASDVVLLPYRSITGSGVALAALTLGRGLIASDLPFFADLLRNHPNGGRVFATGDSRSMSDAILEYLKIPAAEREQGARDLAARFDWQRLVPPVAWNLRELVSDKLGHVAPNVVREGRAGQPG
jgi:glycosyltransferase involved in cell wall biosynthesis